MAKKQNINIGQGIASAATRLTAAEVAKDIASGQLPKDTFVEDALGQVAGFIKGYVQQSENVKNEFLNQMPEGYQVELLDDQTKEKFTDFAIEAKNEFAKAAATAGKFSANPNSEEYRQAVKTMEKIKTGLQKNFDDFKYYADSRADLIENANNLLTLAGEDQVRINDRISEKGYQYLTPTMEGVIYDDGVGKPTRVSKLGTGTLINPNLGQTVSNDILIAGNKLARDKFTSPDLANKIINNNVRAIVSDPNNVRQIAFQGLNNDPDTRYIDYYILNNAIAGTPGFDKIKVTDADGDGKITMKDKVAGQFVFEDDASAKAFQDMVVALKNNEGLDLTNNVADFLVNLGLDEYNATKSMMSQQLMGDSATDPKLAVKANKYITFFNDLIAGGDIPMIGKSYQTASIDEKTGNIIIKNSKGTIINEIKTNGNLATAFGQLGVPADVRRFLKFETTGDTDTKPTKPSLADKAEELEVVSGPGFFDKVAGRAKELQDYLFFSGGFKYRK